MGQDIVINAQTVIAGLFVVINVIGLGIGGLVIWVARSAVADLRELEKAHNELKQALPVDYVMKTDYSRDIAEIKSMLRSIFDRLDQKADKNI